MSWPKSIYWSGKDEVEMRRATMMSSGIIQETVQEVEK